MTLEFKKDLPNLLVIIEGSIDTLTAPELEEALYQHWDGVSELTLDFANVDYISSAGLRVIMCADQHMNEYGSMVIVHANEDVKEIFEMTGFDELLKFE